MITAFETFSGETVVSSGLTQSRETQMANLTANAAKLIEDWLAEQNQEFGWFQNVAKPATGQPVPLVPTPAPGLAPDATLDAPEPAAS